MRINRYLALSGLGSRRSVEQKINDGLIYVDDQQVKDLAFQVGPDDRVTYLDRGRSRLLQARMSNKVFAFNKPRGYICSRSDPKNQTPSIYTLLPLEYQSYSYIGRLDIDSSGLLLFSENGDLVYRLTHPSYAVPRVYEVQLSQPYEIALLKEQMKNGIMIEGRLTTKPILFAFQPKKRLLRVRISEGRNREIRRLFAHYGYQVTHLNRSHYGSVELAKLPRGGGRLLNKQETKELCRSVGLNV